jgi:hypothetical protein
MKWIDATWLKQQAFQVLNGYRLPENDLCPIRKDYLTTDARFRLNSQPNKGIIAGRRRMLLAVLPVPVMKNMIGYSLTLAPLFLRKFAGQPRSDTGKHLFLNRFIFDHTFFCCIIIDDINTGQ